MPENVDAIGDQRRLLLQQQLARAEERYMQWRIGQQRDLQAREMALERLKAEIDQRVSQSAAVLATSIAQMEMQIAQYAEAINRALTYTENPHASAQGAVPSVGQAESSAPAPLSLPG